MKRENDLKSELSRIDGRGYKAYKDIRGQYSFDWFTLSIDHVQGDPFAAPSRLHIEVEHPTAGFPDWCFESKSRTVAFRDYIARSFARAASKIAKGRRGSGKGGTVRIDTPEQEVLERSCVQRGEKAIEVRFFAGLPAFGRKVAGREATAMFCEEIPAIAREVLRFQNHDADTLRKHVETVEDADYIRDGLAERGAIAFVADGAILPRASGADDRPMAREKAVPFESPEELRTSWTLPNGGTIQGMELKKGVNLIVGGGYHGKSTLLTALERGVYNHIPGDGREFAIADPAAVKIRAEDGRPVASTCISPFISDLPRGARTDDFSSQDASGSTSQAANIVEALEAGATTLLIDEDTSATNFMIRDHRMQELVAPEHEPITPFIDKVRQLFDELDVSTVLVLGGSGDYFDVADEVIAMQEYRPERVTDAARRIAEKHRTNRQSEGGSSFGTRIDRVPVAKSLDASKGKFDAKTKTFGLRAIQFGTHEIDLQSVEQLVDESQTRAIADALLLARSQMDGERTVAELLRWIENRIATEGLDVLSRGRPADLARFRVNELACALNRLRSLRVTQRPARENISLY